MLKKRLNAEIVDLKSVSGLLGEPKTFLKKNAIKGSNMVKDPADWKTGDEPMTGAQHSYLETLSAEAGEPFDGSLSKAAASKKIEELQQQTGRGV